MHVIYLCIAILFAFASCKNTGNKDTENSATQNSENKKDEQNNSNGFWEKLVMNEIGDGKGGVAAIVPMPSNWKFANGGISGPNGLKITDYRGNSFMYNYDRSLQNIYAQNGQMRELPNIEQLIQEDFIPLLSSNGLQYIKSYEIPEISKMDKWYSDQLFKAMPSRSDVKAFGSDWKTKEGNPYFLLIHINASTSQTMQNWSYFSSGLEAEPQSFEKAKKQYIFALANTRYNLEPIMAYNKEEAQRCGQSWAAFNKRMAINQAAFEANQIAHINRTNAINDAITSNYNANNTASDKRQEQTIDGIYERTNVQNTETGQTYKVQEGANQYWMNNNGEYIGTKQQGYNPNLDDNMNEQKWQELQRINQ